MSNQETTDVRDGSLKASAISYGCLAVAIALGLLMMRWADERTSYVIALIIGTAAVVPFVIPMEVIEGWLKAKFVEGQKPPLGRPLAAAVLVGTAITVAGVMSTFVVLPAVFGIGIVASVRMVRTSTKPQDRGSW
jgi:hypothetical protein